MGTWGPGLYQSDYALDLKAEIELRLRLPLELAGVVSLLAEDHDEARESDDQRHPEFWLVLHDQLYVYGQESELVANRAHGVIQDGADLAVWRDLDADESAIKDRSRALKKLTNKWSTPRNRPRKRKIIVKPESYCLAVGDVVALPFFGPATKEVKDECQPHGWSAFVVFHRLRQYDVFPRYCIAQLTLDTPGPPNLQDCLAADIDHMCHSPMASHVDPSDTVVGTPVWDADFVEEVGLPPDQITDQVALEFLQGGIRKMAGDQVEQHIGFLNPDTLKSQARLYVIFKELTEKTLATWRARSVGRADLNLEAIRKDFPFVFNPTRKQTEGTSNSLRFHRGDDYGPMRLSDFRWPIAPYIRAIPKKP